LILYLDWLRPVDRAGWWLLRCGRHRIQQRAGSGSVL